MKTPKEIKKLIDETKGFVKVGIEPFPAALYTLQARWDKELKKAIDITGSDVTNELFLILNSIREDNSTL